MILVPVKNLSSAKQRLSPDLESRGTFCARASHVRRRARKLWLSGRGVPQWPSSPATRLPAIWPRASISKSSPTTTTEVKPAPSQWQPPSAAIAEPQHSSHSGRHPPRSKLPNFKKLPMLLRHKAQSSSPTPLDAARMPRGDRPPIYFRCSFGNDSFLPHLAAARCHRPALRRPRIAQPRARRRSSRRSARNSRRDRPMPRPKADAQLESRKASSGLSWLSGPPSRGQGRVRGSKLEPRAR